MTIADQYRTIVSRAGWIDRSARGRVRFQGADARSFLQGLLTNDLSTLAPDRGVYAAYLTPQGRMITDITVLDRGESGLLGLVPEGQGASLAARFDLLIFAEAVTVADATSEFAEVEVAGKAAAEVVANASGLDAEIVTALPELGQIDSQNGFVLRAGSAPFPTFRVFVAAAARDALVGALESSGAIAMSADMATALRIEAGRGEWGRDLSEDVIPLEAGLLDRAISTSKGCYVGQEIVIRMLHRGGGRVAKRLVTLAFDPSVDAAPPEKASLEVDGTTVGHLTSVAFSPARQVFVALGYLRREAAELGRQVTVSGSGPIATVTGFGQ